ncbi:hypothetical protein E0Z10_g1593 [Xylaria hypoxylon]|uniref:Uncharacterized protein n=1 Tax=Xylaria hypoxylon TaxID=37992 RepID=A0A4Z0YSY2_9PEZI|nr:hypothetical protein E0Z10_g1593 [Xylaria hypoxylon]
MSPFHDLPVLDFPGTLQESVAVRTPLFTIPMPGLAPTKRRADDEDDESIAPAAKRRRETHDGETVEGKRWYHLRLFRAIRRYIKLGRSIIHRDVVVTLLLFTGITALTSDFCNAMYELTWAVGNIGVMHVTEQMFGCLATPHMSWTSLIQGYLAGLASGTVLCSCKSAQ